MSPLHNAPQRTFPADEVFLPYKLIEGSRTHPGGERGRFLRRLEQR